MIVQINKKPKGSLHGWEKRKEGAKQRKFCLPTHLSQSDTDSTSNVPALPSQRVEQRPFFLVNNTFLGEYAARVEKNVRNLWEQMHCICILLRKCHHRSVYLNCGP